MLILSQDLETRAIAFMVQNKIASLTPEARQIIAHAATEPPRSGKYNLTNERGTYLCRQCGKALFRSSSKFISSCGWPSFDDEIKGAVARLPDPDGRRTEIRCSCCQAHLGHVFLGEGSTAKNLRHCVNSLSVDFAHSIDVLDSREIIIAGGCFWGMEHFFKLTPGVIFTEVGYIGGTFNYPSYKTVCSQKTGHYEALRVIFDTHLTDEESLYKLFFEIHDPTQSDGQAGDIGPQYQSAIFYYDQNQESVAKSLMKTLKQKGYDLQTKLIPCSTFWPAEENHQDYLTKNPQGYCSHRRVQRF